MAFSFHAAQRRRSDPNIMFVVNYVDGRSAYLFAAAPEVGAGDFLARSIAAERQTRGEIPADAIASVRRVR